jgi:hypothetical protein
MISENCSIEEFVETVKSRETWEVLSLAIDEALSADRMCMGTHPCTETERHCGKIYSTHLKQLINYLRFAVNPRRPNDKAYRLYMANWGTTDQAEPNLLVDQPSDTVH